MNRLRDPFPPTPGGFHDRIESTLQALSEGSQPAPLPRPPRAHGKALAIVAAIVAAMALIGAVAAVIGRSGFKQRLMAEGAVEVADLVEEPRLTAAGEGFDFSIDEILWEDGDLYIAYTLAVPEEGDYLVAMSTPTLNGAPMTYDAKGWTTPKFIDGDNPAVLLMGGEHGATCNELWTFAVDSRLKQRDDNRLTFRAALYRSNRALEGTSDWTDMLSPPDSLSTGALAAIESAEYVAERVIEMDLNAAKLPQTVYNDVTEHDFNVNSVRLHVEAFRMTHLGIAIEYTLSGGFSPDEVWGFFTPEGATLGESLGATGGAALEKREDGGAVYRCSYRDSVLLPLNGLRQIAFAPQGDVARGILLTPTFNPDIVDPTPRPAMEHGEDISR